MSKINNPIQAPINSGLTEEQIRAIENYGNDIKALKDFVTAIRKRKGMYIGHTGSKGCLTMAREIINNCCDQILDQTSPGSYFILSYNEATLEFVIEDNGKGIPPEKIIEIMTTAHTSKNFEKRLYDYSSGLNGSGASIVNALSEVFIVESYKYDGTAFRVEFNKGYPTKKGLVSIPNKECKQGTRITFIPDTTEEGMGPIDLSWKTLYNLTKRLVSLLNIGATCYFTAIDKQGKVFKEDIINKDGIITDLIMKMKAPIIKPITIFNDDGTHRLSCAFSFDSDEESLGDADVTAFSNFVPTLGGTHIDGTIDGICKWFCNYMNNIYLLNQKAKDKLKIIPADIKQGLCLVVSAAHLEPNLIGQSKEILSNEDMIPFCRDTVINALNEWSKSNPSDLAKMAKFFKDLGDLRMKQSKEKEKIVQKYSSSSATGGLPRKYKRPTGNKNIELVICEGDSALGTIVKGRDEKTQGIFPIRGKIINAFSNSKTVFFNNEEVQGINRIILGGEYRKNFDISECKVSKVIFFADADPDGGHICTLLERMFIMYYPQMIQAGMIYKATPPLYSFKVNGKDKYFTENIDMIRYNQKAFSQKFKIENKNHQVITKNELTVFFMKNIDYIYFLEKMANTYALNPYLLEVILNHYVSNHMTIKIDKLSKEISGKFRFMTAHLNKSSSVVVEGTIDKYNIVVLSHKFFEDCKEIIDIINSNDNLYYYIDKSLNSIYDIMKLYGKIQPAGVHRYKGLGEMGKQQLAESALHPLGDRVLYQYTMEDLKESMTILREYESDKKKILALTGTVSREQLLD